MTKKLHTWDELLLEIQQYETPAELAELAEATKEGGWEHHKTLPNGVEMLKTDRHFALQVMAEDANEADVLFSVVPEYCAYYED